MGLTAFSDVISCAGNASRWGRHFADLADGFKVVWGWDGLILIRVVAAGSFWWFPNFSRHLKSQNSNVLK